MAQTVMPPDEEPAADDYIIERDDEMPRASIGAQAVRVVRALLVVILAAASLALFWLVGTMVGLF